MIHEPVKQISHHRSLPLPGFRASMFSLFVFLTVFSLIASAMYFGSSYFFGEQFFEQLSSIDNVTSENVLQVTTYLLVAIWVVYKLYANKLSLKNFFSKIRHRHYPKTYVRMVLLALLFHVVVSGFFGLLIDIYFPIEYPKTLYTIKDTPYPFFNNLLSLSLLVIFAPLVEEMLFRGVLLNSWGRKSLRVGIIFSGLLFCVLHMEPVGAFLFAVIMSLVYLRTKNLAFPVLLHFLNNALVAPLMLNDLSATVPEPITYDSYLFSFIVLGVGIVVLFVPAMRFLRQEWRELVSER